MAGAALQAVTKAFGETQVIHGVDFTIDDGEFCVFVGPSGCGKSTLLRMIAGLEHTTSGRIRIGDDDVTHAEPSERGVAMVFQTYALYPHMTVEQNMGFGLKMTGHKRAEIDRRVAQAAEILKLDPYLRRKPKALSGGQRQRVAIGRAIVRNPKIFLFDEPLSNLDAELRVEMRVEIARLHRELGATMIYVTHDQVEAMTLADKIVVLRAGRIEQVGRPMDLFDDPDSQFVAGFIGTPSMNFLAATLSGRQLRVAALDRTLEPHLSEPGSGAVTMGVRPDRLRLQPDGAFAVDLVERLGAGSLVYLLTPTGERMIVETSDRRLPDRGARVGVVLDPADIYVFDRETGQRRR